ncbi:hypothetical protein A1O3_07215 [Capronia epimyces CBS 606.96]|uniref:Transcription factor domain-containing protein n=1 Tax=Capronia epimyces CBS 606.96 TaxID=1182542 RepID=W9XKA1_9EURO|nr:uncharacterized protein A1O3_07215 [Capronia epimyces CBS 606.96]EXJ80927.1 hypothetical protein A1O3_07215 [Capronia epimyces CBS 606.96]
MSRFCSMRSTCAQYPNTQPQTLDDLNVDAQDIDECFSLFFDKYLPYLPIYQKKLRPNECHNSSRFLFWTIVAIGARKYSKDPTLILLLAPKVMEAAKTAIFCQDKILATIQALILLCTWQMPINTLQKDTTPTLAGAMIQLASNIGLHVYGTVQDFSRVPLKYDRQHRDFRTKLWALCLLTCQRVNNYRGLPPLVMSDTYSHEGYKEDPLTALPPSLVFQRRLSQLHSEAILEIEHVALSQTPEVRNVTLGPTVNNVLSKLSTLAVDCPSKIDRYLLLSARALLSTNRLIAPSSYIDSADLITLYTDACTLIELTNELDEEEQFAEFGPSASQSVLTHAALIVLRVGRSHIAGSLDEKRGRKCYFTAIQLSKKHSVRSDDISARVTIILSQLWTSKMVITQPDGTPDSLWLRCRNRLGLSLSFDSLWLWRQEFGGHPNPYDGVEVPANPFQASLQEWTPLVS